MRRAQAELEQEMRLDEQLHGTPPLPSEQPPLPSEIQRNDAVSGASRGAMEARSCVAEGDWKKEEEVMTPSQLLGFAIAEV